MNIIIVTPGSTEVPGVIRLVQAEHSAIQSHRRLCLMTALWVIGAGSSEMGEQMCMTREVKDDTQLCVNLAGAKSTLYG